MKFHMDPDATIKTLNDFERRQVPFATAIALNKTADLVDKAHVHEMRDVFDRPTPFTLHSTFHTRASKQKLEVTIGLKDHSVKAIPAAKFLRAQILGGSRTLKRFEVALRSAGVLPSGYYAVPGQGAKLDNYGNMSRAQIVQILSWFRAFPDVGSKKNSTAQTRARKWRGTRKKRGAAFFAVRPGDVASRRAGLIPGIYQRVNFGSLGTAIKPVLIFVTRAVYEPVYDFDYVSQLTIEREFPRQFRRALAEALRTAR